MERLIKKIFLFNLKQLLGLYLYMQILGTDFSNENFLFQLKKFKNVSSPNN